MFKNILIPTDGSDLAAKAVEQGVLFAKEIGAKITAVTVTEPFHVLSLAPSELEYTPIEYKKHELGGFDLSLTGFGDLELKDLLADRTAGLTDPRRRGLAALIFASIALVAIVLCRTDWLIRGVLPMLPGISE